MSANFSLAALDERRPLTPDPAIRAANLDALALHDPALADLLRNTSPPDNWQPIHALDDFPTWGTPAGPLGGTHAPFRRAEAVAIAAGSDQAVALASLGTGAEVLRILERLAPLLAVFAFEPDPRHLAAVLATVDLADALRTRRLVPLCAAGERADEHDLLRQCLDDAPGLLPPVRIVALPDTPGERIAALRAVCENAARAALAERESELGRYAANPPVAAADTLAILAFTTDPLAHRLAGELAEAADAAGWLAHLTRADGPRSGHLLAAARRLAADRPRTVLSIGPLPERLGLPAGARRINWVVSAADAAATDSSIRPAAATPALAQQLGREAIDLWIAAPDLPEATAETDCVLLCGDRPVIDPRALGIVQPTHRLIWNALGEVAAAAVGRPEPLPGPERLLTAAERRAGVSLASPELRQRMNEIVRLTLIPHLVLETITRVLAQTGLRWQVVGAEWDHPSAGRDNVLATTLSQLSERQWNECPTAMIFAGAPEPPLTDLLHAAGRGWPIVVPVLDGRTEAVPPELLPPACLWTPRLADLATCLGERHADRQGTRERGRRARAAILGGQTWSHRIATLRAALSASG